MTIEEYIGMRKKESNLKEFDFDTKLENLSLCISFVLDYFNKYLNISEEDRVSALHENKLEEYKKRIRFYNEECQAWLLDLNDKYDIRLDQRVNHLVNKFELFFLFNTEQEFRECSYECYNNLVIKLPFLKSQGEMLHKLIKNVFTIKSEAFIDFSLIDIPIQSIIDWITEAYYKHSVNIYLFADTYLSDFSSKFDQSNNQDNKKSGSLKKDYDYKKSMNLFDIDNLFEKIGHKPFMKSKKKELEILFMYVWTNNIISGEKYWNKYLERVSPYIEKNSIE